MNAEMYHQRQHQRGRNVLSCRIECELLMGYETGSHFCWVSKGFRRVIDDGDVVWQCYWYSFAPCSLLCVFGFLTPTC